MLSRAAYACRRGFNSSRRVSSSVTVDSDSDGSATISWGHVEAPQTAAGSGTGTVYKFEHWIKDNGPYNMQLIAPVSGEAPAVRLHGLSTAEVYSYCIRAAQGDGSYALHLSGEFDLSEKKETDGASHAELQELEGLDIRVGLIRDIAQHPDADQLYVETVDVGEEHPRTIVSGLVKYCSADDLLNRRVVVLCNLKPRALRGVKSHGMLLCASDKDHLKVSPLNPPHDAAVGERIFFRQQIQSLSLPAGKQSTKLFEKLSPGFIVNADGVGTFKGCPFLTSSGPCTSTIVGSIS